MTKKKPATAPAKTPKPKRSETHLTANVLVELVKPLNADWGPVGDHLRDLRDVGHRLVNAGIRGCELEGLKEARPAADAALSAYREWNATMAKKSAVAVTKHQSALAKAERAAKRDASKAEEMEAARKALRDAELGLTRFERRRDVVITGRIIDSWVHRAVQMVISKRKEMMRGDCSLPTVRKGTPIQIRDGAWTLRKDDQGHVIGLPLYATRGHRVDFAIGVSGGGAHGHLRRMLSGDANVKLGDVKVLWDERKSKWIALISYSWPKPELIFDPDKLFVVRRGIRSVLYAAASTGWVGPFQPAAQRPGDADGRPTGCQLLDVKRRLDARRRALQKHHRVVFPGARGHGRARRYEAVTKIKDAEARFVKTFCQQAAAWVAKNAKAQQCGTVVLEDWSSLNGPKADRQDDHEWWLLRRWPWAELKSAIEWACKKEGIAIREVTTIANLRRCANTNCGHVHERPQYIKFLCEVCGFERPAELVAALNMLREAGGGAEVQKINKRVAKARERLREIANGEESVSRLEE